MPDSPVVLVVGAEELLVARAIRRLLDAERAAQPDVEVRDVRAVELAPGDLAEHLSPSLFSETRVLVVRGVHELGKDVADELVRYAADPAPDVRLVLQHDGGAKGKALLTALQAARRVDVSAPTTLQDRREFLREELRAEGRTVDDDAVGALLEAVGNDLRELSSAASQLLADTEGAITADVVALYHRGRAEASGFAIADRAVEGDLAGALELLRWGRATGLAHVLVTSALASGLRAVAQVASAGRQPPHVLASQLGMPAWKVRKVSRQVQGWRPEGLSAAVAAVARADAAVKGAAYDAEHAVERMLLEVVQARAGAA